MFNPYRHLLTKVTALLRAEAKMSAEDRRRNQWQLLVQVCDTQLTIGKGDVNTIFFQFGNDERKVCFPDQILDRLSTYAAQKYVRYEVVNAAGKSRKAWSIDLIKKKIVPEKGMKLYGHAYDGERFLLHKAVQGLDGYDWK